MTEKKITPETMYGEPYPGPDEDCRHRYQVLVTLTTEPVLPSLLSYVRDALEGKLRSVGAPVPVHVESLAGAYQGHESDDPASESVMRFARPEEDEMFLLRLVDVVWGVAREDESVPSTDWATKMILQARDSYGGSAGRRVSLAAALVALGRAMRHSIDPVESRVCASIAAQHVREALAYVEPEGESAEEVPEPDAHVTDGGTAASRDVLAERLRQQRAEGWLFVNDDAYTTGELAWAAVSYAAPEPVTHDGNDPWPWDPRWNKRGKDRRRDLVKAGALILAEIERLDRQRASGNEEAAK
jgi:hypothetical protein